MILKNQVQTLGHAGNFEVILTGIRECNSNTQGKKFTSHTNDTPSILATTYEINVCIMASKTNFKMIKIQ